MSWFQKSKPSKIQIDTEWLLGPAPKRPSSGPKRRAPNRESGPTPARRFVSVAGLIGVIAVVGWQWETVSQQVLRWQWTRMLAADDTDAETIAALIALNNLDPSNVGNEMEAPFPLTMIEDASKSDRSSGTTRVNHDQPNDLAFMTTASMQSRVIAENVSQDALRLPLMASSPKPTSLPPLPPLPKATEYRPGHARVTSDAPIVSSQNTLREPVGLPSSGATTRSPDTALSNTPAVLRRVTESPMASQTDNRVQMISSAGMPIENKLRAVAETSSVLRGLEKLSTEQIIRLLESAQDQLVMQAVEELESRGMKEHHVELAMEMARGSSAKRISAMEKIAHDSEVNPIPWLFWMAESKDRNVRMKAVAMLGATADEEAFRKLRLLKQRELDNRVAEQITQVLLAAGSAGSNLR